MTNGTSQSTLSRVWIDYSVVTEDELRIGGELRAKGDGTEGSIAEVERDATGRPFLRGSSLKGAIRSWLEARGLGDDLKDLLGWMADGRDEGQAAKVEFGSAWLQGNAPASRQRASTAISRRTRTVAERMLRTLEFVPRGTRFSGTVVGRNLDSDDLASLVQCLEALHHAAGGSDPIRIGAGGGRGAGRVSLAIDGIRIMGDQEAKAWLAAGATMMPREAARVLSQKEIDQHRDAAKKALGALSGMGPPVLDLIVELRFEGPMLVADPMESKQATGNDNLTDHEPVRGRDGGHCLPFRSFLGAVRSHAERIVRTIAADDATAWRWAPDVDDHASADREDETLDGVEAPKGIEPIPELFGAAGWAGLLTGSDFTLHGNGGAPHRQEFVAIDRFTGGVAGSRKFNANPLIGPVFRGRVSLDLSRCRPWVLGLLAFVERDLREGDIRFGGKSSKGYGRCTGRIVGVSLHGNLASAPTWVGEACGTLGLKADGASTAVGLDEKGLADEAFRSRCLEVVRTAIDKMTSRLPTPQPGGAVGR